MPRKNFRLHIAFLGLALVAAVPRTAPAQDSLQVAGQEQVHIVQVGETLWELARLYMGDPFLWPEIYRINTMVVEDPHWIFPGEELRLVPADETVVAVAPPEGEVPETEQGLERPVEPVVVAPPPPPPPPPVQQDAPTVFVERQSAAARAIRVGLTSSYRAVRRGDFYSAGFLTEGDDLPWADVRGNVEPGSAGGPFGTAPAMLHGRIGVRAPSGATYHVGDTLLIAVLPRDVPGWGRVVLPTGLARVTYAAGRDIEAEIVSQFSRISSGQVAMPVEPFRSTGSARPQPVQEGLSAQIVALRDLHPLPNQQNVIFIDRGRQDGVIPGDIFEVIRPSNGMGDRTPDRVATIQIVHVRERSSSGMVLQIVRTGVRDGAPVRLIAKMPS